MANRLLTGLRIVKKAFIPTALQRRLRKQATDLAGAAATVCLGGGEPPSGATEGNIMRRVLMMALAGTATALATPALADQPAPVDGANCNIVTPTPDAVACSGYWDQNLIAGDALDLTTQHDALAAIGANVPADINDGTRVGPVFDWNTSTFASLPTGTLSSGLLTFGQLLSGITYVGIHFGGANTGLEERTVFYEFDFGSSSVAGITLGEPGFSNAVLYTTTPVRGVPEPATWAMMLLGFGGIGMAMRRGRKQGGRLLQIA